MNKEEENEDKDRGDVLGQKDMGKEVIAYGKKRKIVNNDVV